MVSAAQTLLLNNHNKKKEKYMYVEGKETAQKKILYREMVESA